MIAEMAKRWTDALRSGKYEQGKYWLRKGDRFCCLGVLCDVVGVEWSPPRDEEEGYVANGTDRIGLPDVVKDAAGMRDSIGRYSPSESMTWLNDFLGWDFEQIADFIHTNWRIL